MPDKSNSKTQNKKRIAITGIGPLAAIGTGKKALWNSILTGNTGLTLKDFFVGEEKINTFYTHEIKDFNIDNFGIDKEFLKDIEVWKQEKNWVDLSYLLAATKLALDDSGLSYDRDDNRIGLVLTHENPGLDQFYINIFQVFKDLTSKRDKEGITWQEQFEMFFKKFEKEAYDLQTFMFLYHVSKTFGIHGYSLFLNNACASGLYALEAAADIIKSEKCNAVIVASSDKASVFKYLWFKTLGMYAPDGKIKPFAQNRDGFVLGDGGAGIVLESLDSALKRKAHIYAEYLGGGFSLEGWKVAIPNLISNSYENAILTALNRSKTKKEEIDLIVPHGVGTKVTDSYEANTITKIFGKISKKPFITAFKPYIGHNLGSTALLETVISLLCLEHNLIPPTLNSEIIDPKLNIKLVNKQTKNKLKTILKLSCGFAGYNAACIFKKVK